MTGVQTCALPILENTCNILATNIQTYRKKSRMTQEELANKLGVSFQAVSKFIIQKIDDYALNV